MRLGILKVSLECLLCFRNIVKSLDPSIKLHKKSSACPGWTWAAFYRITDITARHPHVLPHRLMTLLTHLCFQLLFVAARMSAMSIVQNDKCSPTTPTDVALHHHIHFSFEFAGRSALIHIYGSLPWMDVPFLVSVVLGYSWYRLLTSVGFTRPTSLVVCLSAMDNQKRSDFESK